MKKGLGGNEVGNGMDFVRRSAAYPVMHNALMPMEQERRCDFCAGNTRINKHLKTTHVFFPHLV
jgi:hypothetical protein